MIDFNRVRELADEDRIGLSAEAIDSIAARSFGHIAAADQTVEAIPAMREAVSSVLAYVRSSRRKGWSLGQATVRFLEDVEGEGAQAAAKMIGMCWGLPESLDSTAGTLTGDLDRAIERTRAAAEAGDPPQLRAELAELHRLFGVYQSTANHRHADGRGRSVKDTVAYLGRCYGYVDATQTASRALAGPTSAEDEARTAETMQGIAAMIEDAENHGPGGAPP